MIETEEKLNPPSQEGQKQSLPTIVHMRKWMSSADVKCGQRRDSKHHSIKDRKFVTSTANFTNPKSTSKLGPASSFSASHYSSSCFRLKSQEPLYLHEKGILQVPVNGKKIKLPVPDSMTNFDLSRELDAPSCQPSLDWVYGYRGKDCRGNLHELPTGEIVYFTGTIVVLHNIKEKLQRYYAKHTSDIKCMAVHPNRLHVATGQTSRRFREKTRFSIHRSPISSITELNNILEADQYRAHVRIWDSVTLQTLCVIGMEGNFDRGVQCCAFSRGTNGIYLAVIDDSYEHTLSIWDWRQEKKLIEAKSANDQVFACEFHPLSTNMLLSYGKGHCNLWTVSNQKVIKKPIIFQGRNKPKLVLCSQFTEYGNIITGDSNGTLTLWDTSEVEMIRQALNAHVGGVWALCSLKNAHFLSAGKDGSLTEWQTNDLTKLRVLSMFSVQESGYIRTIVCTSDFQLLIGTTRNIIWNGTVENGFEPIQQAQVSTLMHITAHPKKPQFLASCANDNKLCLYDTKLKTVIWSLQVVQDAICCADFHPEGDIFVTGFNNGSWAVYDFTSQVQLHVVHEQVKNVITVVRFSATGLFLAVATKEKNLSVYVFYGKYHSCVKRAEITDLNSSLITIDWAANDTMLRANDENYQHYIWNSSNGKPVKVEEAKDVIWASARCQISFENACISWALLGSIAAIERSPDEQYIAVALKNGTLRFYQYPTTTTLASYRETYNYSISTQNVTFVGDVLVSDSGDDGTIYQWKLSKTDFSKKIS
ncbi:unnamed protein product [Thelazia callipaeda]|uniref:WD_REPEATS_REGION domain-containing protein n=1 Tax=Thelazia callipaeda TaxID=103827 RepID=A0A0N5D4H3_THECL|nr:unnamed protein product [Thelazia callipaeda]